MNSWETETEKFIEEIMLQPSPLSPTVVYYYDIIDSGRSIKLHSRTDLFWNIRSDVVCPVCLIP